MYCIGHSLCDYRYKFQPIFLCLVLHYEQCSISVRTRIRTPPCCNVGFCWHATEQSIFRTGPCYWGYKEERWRKAQRIIGIWTCARWDAFEFQASWTLFSCVQAGWLRVPPRWVDAILGCLVLYWQHSFISMAMPAKEWTFMSGASFSDTEWNSFPVPETFFSVLGTHKWQTIYLKDID